jgi:aspartate racemase
MKTIGLIGGLSWISSLDYYRLINEITNKRLGGNEAAKIILFSVNYGEIVTLTKAGDWDGLAWIMCDAAKRTEGAGADCILIGANTMHHIAEKVQDVVKVPLLHIADAAAKAIKEKGENKVALLGTRYTMLFDFYKKKLSQHGIETMIPGDSEIDFVNNAIYDEMGKGKFLPETKRRFLQLIDELAARGAEAVILGCTEIPMLIKPEDTSVPIIDTTLQHAIAAVDFALG